MTMCGYEYGWPMLWMVLGNLLWLVLLGLLVWTLVRFLAGSHHPFAREHDALEILCQRYARGELDTAMFEQIRERIIASREREQPPA